MRQVLEHVRLYSAPGMDVANCCCTAELRLLDGYETNTFNAADYALHT